MARSEAPISLALEDIQRTRRLVAAAFGAGTLSRGSGVVPQTHPRGERRKHSHDSRIRLRRRKQFLSFETSIRNDAGRSFAAHEPSLSHGLLRDFCRRGTFSPRDARCAPPAPCPPAPAQQHRNPAIAVAAVFARQRDDRPGRCVLVLAHRRTPATANRRRARGLQVSRATSYSICFSSESSRRSLCPRNNCPPPPSGCCAQGEYAVAEAHFEKAIATFQHYCLPWEEADTLQYWVAHSSRPATGPAPPKSSTPQLKSTARTEQARCLSNT